MSNFDLQKRLLVAESDLNRQQLATEASALTAETRAIVSRVTSIGTLAASATALVAGLATLTRGPPASTGKTSWLQTVLSGASLAASLWRAFSRPGRDHHD